MRKGIGLLDVDLLCEDCGKIFNNNINGQALAAKHAKHYKHRVTGEITICIVYDGREELKH